MNTFLITILNGLVFATYSYFVSYIVLQKNGFNLKRVLIALIPFLGAYYCILCLLESIYAIFFSGLLAFFFIKIIFKENIFISLFISIAIHTVKIITKILFILITNQEILLLVNSYNTLNWNEFFGNLITLALASLIVFIFRNFLRKFIKYVSSLTCRKTILLIAIYLNFILILIYQRPDNLFSLAFVTDFLMIFAITGIGIFSISSEMKMECLSRYYQEMFNYSKANGELLTHYKMQVHENRNRLIMIKGMLDGPKKETKKYIDTILAEIDDNKTNSNYWLTELKYIPLAGIRNFINYKLGALMKLGAEIEVFVSSELEKLDATSVSDKEYNQLSTILGVILDNMIDSIKITEEKLISINIYIEDNEVHAEFVNTFSGVIDLSRLNEIGYSTKGETHGMGLPLVNKITRQNKRFACGPKIMNNFFIQHLTIKILDKDNLQKITKN